MNQIVNSNPWHAPGDDQSDLKLIDEDVLDAMRQIQGYLDISTGDFRTVYHLVHSHAVDRLFQRVRAGQLSLKDLQPLYADARLDAAARQMVAQGRKSLPVVDACNCVVGILTETDFLRRLRVRSFLELLLNLVEGQGSFVHRCHETSVSEAMASSPITIAEQAGYRDIVDAFQRHAGRSMPVVDAEGHLKGPRCQDRCRLSLIVFV